MKIGLLSDLHGKLPNPQSWPELDYLLIAGDIAPNWHWDLYRDSQLQLSWFEETFEKWCKYNKAKQTIFITGNHDVCSNLQDFKDTYNVDNKDGIPICINNSFFYIKNHMTIFGLPQTKMCGSWTLDNWFAGISTDDQMLNYLPDSHPGHIDILLTHGPCKDILDYIPQDNEHAGSNVLAAFVKRCKIPYVVSGHIHEAQGLRRVSDTVYINPFNQLHILDI